MVIDRGDVVARVDLRPLILVRADSDEPEVHLAPFDVPPLRAPIAEVTDPVLREVLFVVPSPPPAWLTDEERDMPTIPFEFGRDPRS
jgi:hypothetical protein